MKPAKPQPTLWHLFGVAPLRVWATLLRENGGVSRPYWGAFAKVLATSTLTMPLRILENLVSRPRLARMGDIEPPVQIHGFARSGTTLLQNLMTRDPNFGYVSNWQVAASPFCLVGRGWLDRLVARKLPKTRPMDRMEVSLDLPQEEDVAVAGISHLSYIHMLSFPHRAQEFTEKYFRMRLTAEEQASWEQAYMTVLRKATLASDGRRLVLKSPSHLGRTPTLLRMFPDAKFVYIMRSPYDVYPSLMRMYRKNIPSFQLAPIDWERFEAVVRQGYAIAMRRYMEHRESIPEGNLVEVRFEDLERDPMGELERVYATLGLPGWERARHPIRAYLDTQAGYRKNRYRIDREMIDIVDREWGFAVREWGYEPPSAVG